MEENTLTVNSIEAIESIGSAFSHHSKIQIYRLLTGWRNISNIARIVGSTTANVSAIVKKFEKHKLVDIKYEPGEHGTSKYAKAKYTRFILEIENNESNIQD